MTGKTAKPVCYIIAGPNGAGKTTFALKYLPAVADCKNFINADLIAGGLSPLAPDQARFAAGKLFLKEIQKQIAAGNDFAFETTLSGRSYLRLIKAMQQDGWEIVLFYLWIPSASFSRERVRERVRQGGHNIPDEVIRRRYPKSIRNLIKYYAPLCDQIFCYDNSSSEPRLIFSQEQEGLQIRDSEVYQYIERYQDDHE